MNKKILVTGCAGYIGSIATYHLLKNGYSIIGIDSLANGYEQPIQVLKEKFGQDKITFYHCDLTTERIKEILKKEQGIEAVLHFAAYCSVDESMKNPFKYFHNNCMGSLNLIEAMTENGISKLVFSSTCATYGESQYIPIDEKHPTLPLNPYGESKRITEQMIYWYSKQKNLKHVILRYFNVCGASDDGFIGDSKKPSLLLVQNAVKGALGIEPFFLTCPEVDTPDGTPIRDYINVNDLAEGHIKALQYLDHYDESQIINLGTGTGNSVLEIVKEVEQVTGKKIERQKTTPRQGEYPKVIASIEKAEKLLGWKPTRTLDDSIKSLVTWYNAHPHGWDK